MKSFIVPKTHPRVAHWAPYFLNNSLTGIRMAKAAGYKYIDQDCNITSDGVIIVEHWGLPYKDGYTRIVVGHDKNGKEIRIKDPNPNKKYGERPYSEVKRLRRIVGSSHPATAAEHLKWCHDRGIIPWFEMKSNRFADNPKVWEPVLAEAKRLNASFGAMTLSDMPDPFRKLKATKSLGIPSVLLNHSGRAFRARNADKISKYCTAVWG